MWSSWPPVRPRIGSAARREFWRLPRGATRSCPAQARSGLGTLRRDPDHGQAEAQDQQQGQRQEPQQTARSTTARSSNARGRRPASARSRDPILILVGWVGHAVAAAWMVAANAVGFGARRIGRNARDLDPDHRRDGVGLVWLAVAFVLAASIWWGMGNLVGHAVSAFVHGAAGSAAWLAPLLAGMLSWRYLRHPEHNAQAGRVAIGWSALTIGVLGLLHIANGTPAPSDGEMAMRHAGGLIGFVVSAPLSKALTAYVAAPVLALVAGFGILVITGTPLHRVPDRVEEAREYFGRRTRVFGEDEDYGEEYDEDDDPAALESGTHRIRGQLAKGVRGARGAIEGADRVKPYDSPLITPNSKGRKGAPLDDPAAGLGDEGGPPPGAQPGPEADEGLLEALGFLPGAGGLGGIGTPGGAPGPPGPPAATWPTARPTASHGGPGPRRPAGGAGALPQARAAHADRRRDQLHAAAGRAAAARQRAQGADQGQRRDGQRRCPRCWSSSTSTRRSPASPAGPTVTRYEIELGPGGQGRAGHRADQEHRLRGEERGRADHLARSPASPRSAWRSRTPTRRSSAWATCCARRSRSGRPPPDGRRPGQGRRGPHGRGQPGQDAAHADRRRHRRRQVGLHQRPDHLDPDCGPPRTRCGWSWSTPSGSS